MAYLNKRARIGMIAAALLSMSLLSSCGSDSFMLDVLAIGEGGAEVTGEYQKQVEYGGSTSFELSVPEGETVIQVFCDDVLTDAYTYENGILTLNGITAPQTVRIVAGDGSEKVYWGAESSDTKYGGYVQSNVEQGRVEIGSMVTMNAVARDGAKFTGWSKRRLLDAGGELVSTNEQLTVEVGETLFLYANFDTSGVDIPEEKPQEQRPQSSANAVTIFYNNNGGDVLEGNKAAIETTFNTSYWKTAVGIEDDGTITREGYVLLGYSTDPDGSAELIRPGYRYLLENGEKMLTLYAIWAEETDPSSFTYTDIGSNNVRIDSYTGSDSVVYIPREIDGKTVKQLAGGSFADNSTITEVHITSSITVIEEKAFANCPNLTAVTLYDNITKISDASFEGSPVDTIRFCAATKPRNVTSSWSFGKKFERLLTTADDRRVVILSGSSQYYGVDTDTMQPLFPDGYTVINYGTNANANVLFFLEAVSSYLDEDDILLYTPEQYGKNTYYTSGNPEFPLVTMTSFEGGYNLFEHFAATNYTGVFDAISDFTNERMRLKSSKWDTKAEGIDQFGDYTYIRKNLNDKNFHHDNNGEFHFDDTVIPEDFLVNMNRVLDLAAETGATIYFGHPSYNYNAVIPEYRNDEAYDAYNKYLEEVVHAELISDVRDYIYEGQYFADTDYHLNMIGRVPHSKKLAADIKAALGIE